MHDALFQDKSNEILGLKQESIVCFQQQQGNLQIALKRFCLKYIFLQNKVN
jgi:hypothetical protein